MDYTRIAIKLVIGFFGLWFMTKLLGKKEISQLTPFDFISSLMLSELVGNTIYNPDTNDGELLFALALWMALSFLLAKVQQLFPRLAFSLSGRPDIVIRDGRIDRRAMERNKLELQHIGMLLREQGIFSLREVAYAIFEPNGSLSVLRTSSAASVTRGDLGLPEKRGCMARIVVDNGYIEEEELKEIGRDKRWLLGELERQGVVRLKEVLYAEWSEEGGLYVQKK